MKSTPKWLMIPPVVAALLVLGPLSMGGAGAETSAAAATERAADAAPAAEPASPTTKPARPTADVGPRAEQKAPGSLVPRTPDMWQMSSALVGVLLLGAGGLLLLKKLRGGASPRGGQTLATLRQTVRLSTKQALHAVEFDNRILLIGEGDKGLTLIDRGGLPESLDDEAAVLARAAELDTVVGDDDEDGAVPKDLVIPRPARPAARTAAPTAPRSTAPARAEAGPKAPARPTAKLTDFRALLAKAGR